MQIISPSQSRAARALLNWSQPELAERCGIHVQTISNFEKGNSTPSKKTLEKISTVLQRSGIAFLDEDGVKRSQNTVQQYNGVDGFRSFMDDVYEMAKTTGGEFCLLNAKPANWIAWLGQDWQDFHVTRMKKIMDRFTFKITTRHGETNFISSAFAEYRWVPEKVWNQHSYYAYGDKVAFLDFGNDDINIFVLKHAHFAKTHKFLFNVVWDTYATIPNVKDHKPQRKRAISQKD